MKYQIFEHLCDKFITFLKKFEGPMSCPISLVRLGLQPGQCVHSFVWTPRFLEMYCKGPT